MADVPRDRLMAAHMIIRLDLDKYVYIDDVLSLNNPCISDHLPLVCFRLEDTNAVKDRQCSSTPSFLYCCTGLFLIGICKKSLKKSKG